MGHRILRHPEISLVATPRPDPHRADLLMREVVLVREIILLARGEILEILVLMPGGLEFPLCPTQ